MIRAGPRSDPPGRTMARILIVEDNYTNQRVVAGLLGKRGHQTFVVNQGFEAIQALERADYDLVLMDVQMPVLDGLEATRIIRRNPRWHSLPVVGLTAHAMAGDRETCLEAGMNDYLAKPVRPQALEDVVLKYVPPKPDCHT